MDRIEPRQLLVPLAAGMVSFLVVGGALISDLSTRHEGAEPASVIFGLLTLGPWWAVLAWVPFTGGAVLAGWLTRYLPSLPRREAFVVLFVGIVGTFTAIAVSVLAPLWWPSGLVAFALVVAVGFAGGALAYPGPGFTTRAVVGRGS